MKLISFFTDKNFKKVLAFGQGITKMPFQVSKSKLKFYNKP